VNKYPIVITYKQTHDNGQELRFALRSIKNIKNCNGEVWIVGDKPDWIQNVNHIVGKRSRHQYLDQEYAMLAVLNEERIPETFIYSMDDVYITKRIAITNLHQGNYKRLLQHRGYHQHQKQLTAAWLRDNGYTWLDYELHTPMILEKSKRMKIHKLLKPYMNGGVMLKPRTLYGNIFAIGGDFYEDQKTKTPTLPKAPIISTQYFTDELLKLFPKKSIYEL